VFDSETVPDAGVAPRVIGITTSAATTNDIQKSAARASRYRTIVEVRLAYVCFLNISSLLFLAATGILKFKFTQEVESSAFQAAAFGDGKLKLEL
jgi:hypothetical protein